MPTKTMTVAEARAAGHLPPAMAHKEIDWKTYRAGSTKRRRPWAKPTAQDELVHELRARDVPQPERDAKGLFPGRKFEIDLWWPDLLFGVEVDGQAHYIAGSAETDREKDLAAFALGYRLLRFTARQVRQGLALSVILAVLDDRPVLPILEREGVLEDSLVEGPIASARL